MTTTYLAALIRSLLLEGWRENGGNSRRKEGGGGGGGGGAILRGRGREREMTAGIYQHGVDVFLVFLLEEDDDV